MLTSHAQRLPPKCPDFSLETDDEFVFSELWRRWRTLTHEDFTLTGQQIWMSSNTFLLENNVKKCVLSQALTIKTCWFVSFSRDQSLDDRSPNFSWYERALWSYNTNQCFWCEILHEKIESVKVKILIMYSHTILTFYVFIEIYFLISRILKKCFRWFSII